MKPKQENTAKGKWWDEGVTLVDGCTAVGQGCKHCWSAGITHRFRSDQGFTKDNHWTGKIRCNEHLLKRFNNKNGRFFAIWNDLFHSDVDYDFIDKVMQKILDNPQHIFQVLTKRPEDMYIYVINTIKRYKNICITGAGIEHNNLPNLWLGISASTQDEYNVGIKYLRKTPAAVRFVSFEPLISEMSNIDLTGIGWIIVGAESGHKRRKCDYEWIVKIVEQCRSARVPVFVKQVHNDDGKLIKSKDRFKLPRGNIYRELLEIQEYPEAQ